MWGKKIKYWLYNKKPNPLRRDATDILLNTDSRKFPVNTVYENISQLLKGYLGVLLARSLVHAPLNSKI
jgi:hypothetical protein